MKFDKSQDSFWNALVVYINSQCFFAGSKPQKKNFVLHFILSMKGGIFSFDFEVSLDPFHNIYDWGRNSTGL